MPSFNGWEIFLLLVLAVIIFGPEKLPELARKTARVIHFLRSVANNATTLVKDELGPEYADLKPSDLHPRAILKRELDALGMDDVREEVQNLRRDVDVLRHDVSDADGRNDAGAARTIAYDPDAT